MLTSAFFLFTFASRYFFKIEERAYRIMLSDKPITEIFQYLTELDRMNKKAIKILSIGQIILLISSLFFGVAFIWPFWTIFN